MKGILLAGGSGTRLYPLTKVVSKQLLPIYDKPTIYYPLSTLMLAGIKDILVISTPQDTPRIEALLGDGSQLGIKLTYKVQTAPRGIAEAILLAEEHIDNSPSCLILGDNIFYGSQFGSILRNAAQLTEGAMVFAYSVSDPQNFGVIEVDSNGKPLRIVEKPKEPKSPWAVTGLYFYDSKAVRFAKAIKPSARGELEITDLNRMYLDAGELKVQPLGRGFAWLDSGTPDSLITSAQFVQTVEKRQGLKIACIEEIAFRQGFIDATTLMGLAEKLGNTDYAQYLRKVVNEAQHPKW